MSIGGFIIEYDILKNVDREKFRNTKPYHIVRYRAETIHEQFLEEESMATQAQI